MQSFFTLFDLPATFDLDLAQLEKRYFEAQRKFHPDRLVGRDAAERRVAITQSMLVNEGYEALKQPLARAQHLLALADAAEQKPSHTLLMESMEQREALAEAKSQQALEKIAQANEAAREETLRALSQAFAQGDTAQAGALAVRLSYLVKMEDEIRVKRKSLAA